MRKYPKIGEKYGDWIVISQNIEKYQRWYKYHVKCKCGLEKYVLASTLRTGKSVCCRSCSKYLGIGDLSSTFFSRIKEGAKARNIKMDITIEYAFNLLKSQKYKCALSGLNLIMSKTFSQDKIDCENSTTASLDRINSNLGYIEGNIQWIHKDINIMKNNYDEKYFIKMCKLIAKNNE